MGRKLTLYQLKPGQAWMPFTYPSVCFLSFVLQGNSWWCHFAELLGQWAVTHACASSTPEYLLPKLLIWGVLKVSTHIITFLWLTHTHARTTRNAPFSIQAKQEEPSQLLWGAMFGSSGLREQSVTDGNNGDNDIKDGNHRVIQIPFSWNRCLRSSSSTYDIS